MEKQVKIFNFSWIQPFRIFWLPNGSISQNNQLEVLKVSEVTQQRRAENSEITPNVL